MRRAELQRHHGRDHPDLRIVLRGVLLHARLWRDLQRARIALSERGRELATLRVIGFTRAEISYILLGETALLTLIALPLGCGSATRSRG